MNKSSSPKGFRMAAFVLLMIFAEKNLIAATAGVGPVMDNLVAYYRFDGSAQDASGNELHGAIRGAVPASDRFGENNGALRFNGVSAFVDCGNRPEFNFEESFTLHAWAKFNGPNSARYIIAKYSYDGPERISPSSYGLGSTDDSKVFGFVSGIGPYHHITSNPNLDDGKWHSLSLVYDKGVTLGLYVDGVSMNRLPAPTLPGFVNEIPLTIGKAFLGQWFDGWLDDVRIYRRALTPEEILQQHMSETIADIGFLEQPQDKRIIPGKTATFSVVVSGREATNLAYQWFEDGIEISGAKESVYTTPVQGASGEKIYTVSVNNGSRSITSNDAILTILPLDENSALLAQWTFDEEFESSVQDKTGSYPGQAKNVVRVQGLIGSGAAYFNGTNSFILVGAEKGELELLGTSYTYSWWQKWEGPTGDHQCILSKDDGADVSGGWQAYIPEGSSSILPVHHDGATPVWTEQVPINQDWRHYAVVFDGQNLKFFGDGYLYLSKPYSGSLKSDGDDPLIIGALKLVNGNFDNFFKGTLDDIRIYSRELTPEEIAALGPPPQLIIESQPVGYNVAPGQSVLLSILASKRGILEPLSYQWELNGVPIPEATNTTLQVTGTANQMKAYKARVKAGNFEVISSEAPLLTVSPAEAKMLLHLDFETMREQSIPARIGPDAMIEGNVSLVPGRVGSFALDFSGEGHLRIPAAGTEIELVGTSYTIAWWMKMPDSLEGGQIFTVGRGEPLAGLIPGDIQIPLHYPTGYGARLEGNHNPRALSMHHGNGQQPALITPMTNSALWHHIVLVYNGFSRTIFIDGAIATSGSTSDPIIGTGRDDLLIGAVTPEQNTSIGIIDDFRVYNFPLASDEVAALATVPPPVSKMEISKSSNEITIRWPVTEVGQHRVEVADELGPEGVWSPITAPISMTNYYYRVTQPVIGGARYFRLRKL